MAYAAPPAWARQSWGGTSPVASSPRKVGSRDLSCFSGSMYSKEASVGSTPASSRRDAGVRLDVNKLLAAAAAAAAGHEPVAVRQAQAKLAGKLLLSEQEMAMLRDVASPRAAASRVGMNHQRNAAAAAAAAADQEAAVRLVQLKLAEGQMLTEREMVLLRDAAEADTSLQQLSIEAEGQLLKAGEMNTAAALPPQPTPRAQRWSAASRPASGATRPASARSATTAAVAGGGGGGGGGGGRSWRRAGLLEHQLAPRFLGDVAPASVQAVAKQAVQVQSELARPPGGASGGAQAADPLCKRSFVITSSPRARRSLAAPTTPVRTGMWRL